jgi:predicted component of type VI protein secretion system
MKKEERASINVSKDTRDRFMKYVANLIGLREQLVTQDEAVNEALNCAEAALRKKEG